ncbi:hypothetical protein TIFTF001_010479 [Ficus carica]|uniref:Taxadien-5-alpha-ol O-acetyltransferase n=1 Tax=Ficus carica TaxID=3494 RepID=A0AA87ZQ70_FICCA|nr:hypothetical protein TIFTF001_010479 [Ficus carica]
MGSSERIKEAVVVTPSEPTPSHNLTLSAIDSQLFLRFTIEYLLVYRARPGGGDQASTAARVKWALSKALVPYYPLAGRVRPKPNGSGLLEVVCRAQGAVFIDAVSERTVSDFERAPRNVASWRKLLSVHVADVLMGAPPLVVQLTFLRDGGVALGVGLNHCICDGIGSADFLNLLAELAVGKKSLTEFKPKPIWARHLMDPPRPNNMITTTPPLPEFDSVPDHCSFMTRFSSEQLAPTSFVFNRRSLFELKNIAAGSHSYSFTSFEVLTAHVWRSWAKALSLPPSQPLKLLFSINVRSRVRPSLPVGYYGNAFVLGCAVSTVRELTERGLSYASGLVKTAKERVGDEHVRAVRQAVASGGACPDPVGVLIVSQWSRMGLERVDFGMGRPANVGPICCDRYCLFLPVTDQRDAVRVMVAVPTSAVDKYEYLIRSQLCT